jgi:5-methylcytosine-specific restriction endonuclease McrA
MTDKWVKINCQILVNNPNNWHFDRNLARYSWIIVRKKRTWEVFARDPHKCRCCGSSEKLTIDHIVPLTRGGSNDLDNLQILCRNCNSRKGNRCLNTASFTRR